MPTKWKTVTRESTLFGDRSITVLHHALYNDTCEELIWGDLVWESVVYAFFYHHPEAVLRPVIDAKAGGGGLRSYILQALILAEMVKVLFGEETPEPFLHLCSEEPEGRECYNLLHGEPEDRFFDNICRVVDTLEIDLGRLKKSLLPDDWE